MREPLLYRFLNWVCQKTGHLWTKEAWIYNGFYHRSCGICGRIISEQIKRENDK